MERATLTRVDKYMFELQSPHFKGLTTAPPHQLDALEARLQAGTWKTMEPVSITSRPKLNIVSQGPKVSFLSPVIAVSDVSQLSLSTVPRQGSQAKCWNVSSVATMAPNSISLASASSPGHQLGSKVVHTTRFKPPRKDTILEMANGQEWAACAILQFPRILQPRPSGSLVSTVGTSLNPGDSSGSMERTHAPHLSHASLVETLDPCRVWLAIRSIPRPVLPTPQWIIALTRLLQMPVKAELATPSCP